MLIFFCTQFRLAPHFCVATRSKKHFKLFHFRSREDCFSIVPSCKPVKLDFIFFSAFINGHWLCRCHETEPSFLQTQVDGGIVCDGLGFYFYTQRQSSAGRQKGCGFCAFCKTHDAFDCPAGAICWVLLPSTEIHFYPWPIKFAIHTTDYLDVPCRFVSAMHVARKK